MNGNQNPKANVRDEMTIDYLANIDPTYLGWKLLPNQFGSIFPIYRKGDTIVKCGPAEYTVSRDGGSTWDTEEMDTDELWFFKKHITIPGKVE